MAAEPGPTPAFHPSTLLPAPSPAPAPQAKDAMQHPYFNDFPDREVVEALENPSLAEAQ